MSDKISKNVKKIYFGIISEYINRNSVFKDKFWTLSLGDYSKNAESVWIDDKIRFKIVSDKFDFNDSSDWLNPFRYTLTIDIKKVASYDITVNIANPIMFIKFIRLFRMTKKSYKLRNIQNKDNILMNAIPITYKRKLKIESLD